MAIDEEVQSGFDGIDRRLNSGKERMDALEKAIAENTALTLEIKNILTLAKSFFLLLGYIAKAAKWVSIIGSAAAVLYAMVHGQLPPKD